MNPREQAKEILRHYFSLLNIDPDEVDRLVDLLIAAAVEAVEARWVEQAFDRR